LNKLNSRRIFKLNNFILVMVKIIDSSKSFLLKCKRVWHVLRKPTRKEFEQIAKVAAIGILILGAVGFLISIVMKSVISPIFG